MKERIHGMDALRGIAMWLGVVLHGIIAYQTEPRVGWPIDINSSILMDVIYDFLHAFRMPLFFLIAGFFANFLLKRNGLKSFLDHRAKRILIPFILSILTIIPISNYVFSVNRLLLNSYEGNIYLAAFTESIQWTGFYHLWFLYYLMILYVLMILLHLNLKRIKILFNSFTEAKYFGSTIFLFFIQYFFFDSHVEPWTGIVPKLGQILYFGYFFGLGYIIFNNPDFLFKNKVLRYSYIPLGVILLLIVRENETNMPYWLYSVFVSLQSNLLVLGNIAIFIHLFKKESKVLRYLSDASYWFYLIHLPIVVFLQIFLLDVYISIWFKLFLVISVTTGISVISYQYLVRYTWIGDTLNGKRHKKSINYKPKFSS